MISMSDTEARACALDVTRSFIVEAPAGSGKTGLLMQRYLTLLAQVNLPEEILAITFTRKAAAEMRHRITNAMTKAQDVNFVEKEPYEQFTLDLARRVLERDRQCGWQLLTQPHRLRVMTIDAFCAGLAQTVPLLAGLGAPPRLVEDAHELYRRAARNTLKAIESKHGWTQAIETLLDHLENDVANAETWIAELLSRREQWVKRVVDHREAEASQTVTAMESTLRNWIDDRLQRLWQSLSTPLQEELVALLRYSFANRDADETDSSIIQKRRVDGFPSGTVSELETWRALANLLLTNEGTWRKQITKQQGFPAPSSTKDAAEKTRRTAMKERFSTVVESISGDTALLQGWRDVRRLPNGTYDDSDRTILNALSEVMLLAAAQLELVFADCGEVDFCKMSLAALHALGAEDAPSSLALALDYRLHHILVDEFQDTSSTQMRLLERLVDGWAAGDGKTLFLVGDPKQSIYRFREANVCHFLRAKTFGIGRVSLVPLELRYNFRATAELIEWFNRTLPHVLSDQDDMMLGAVQYRRCEFPGSETNANSLSDAASVEICVCVDRGPDAEATRLIEALRAARDEDSTQSIAILVRARRHLRAILPALRREGVRYRAVELDALADRPVVYDLMTLTRALSDLGDRTAWLALLRAPWCGLSLDDMYSLVDGAEDRLLWDLLNDDARCSRLSDDGQQRAMRVSRRLKRHIDHYRRRSRRAAVEQTWLALGGPACVLEPSELRDADVFFRLLQTQDRLGASAAVKALESDLQQMHVSDEFERDEVVHVMTIHRAKGLEFDTVFLPGLGFSTEKQDTPLFRWFEDGTYARSDRYVLAPLGKNEAMENATVYDFLGWLDEQANEHEQGRLLYVAATRARKRLYWFGTISTKKNSMDETKPDFQVSSKSLLKKMWSSEPRFQAQAEQEWRSNSKSGSQSSFGSIDENDQNMEGANEFATPRSVLRRLSPRWTLPPLESDIPTTQAANRSSEHGVTPMNGITFDWATDRVRHVGTVVHQLLRGLTFDEHPNEVLVIDLNQVATWAGQQLRRYGVRPAELEESVSWVCAAIDTMLSDARGRWILSTRHREIRTEVALSTMKPDRVVETMVIDRTFIDESGTRWIIDYKTGRHEGGALETFLENERRRYTAQLERYAHVMTMLESTHPHPIKLGLYFPLLRGWCEWNYNEQ